MLLPEYRQARMNRVLAALLVVHAALAGCERSTAPSEPEDDLRGPYPVSSTNMEVAPEFAAIGDDAMDTFLMGRATESGESRFLSDILKYPDAAWIVDVPVPDNVEMYGEASGRRLPVVAFVTFPSDASEKNNRYAFPYHDAQYGVFENMLGPGEAPTFADPDKRYPLIVISHGAFAHGIYDVGHAHNLASHGYIVAVLTYGDERTPSSDTLLDHAAYLRPLLTKAVVDSLIESEAFGDHIDADNIGITGHSFGGFTALATSSGMFSNTSSTRIIRVFSPSCLLR